MGKGFGVILWTLMGLVFINNLTFSQVPQGQRPDSSRAASSPRAIPAIGKVMGTVRDSVNNQPLEFVSVALIQLSDSSAAAGSLTNAKGHFAMEGLRPGRYKISITSIGYRKYESAPFVVTPREPLKDLGPVLLSPSVSKLKEVTISGEKAEYSGNLDKKVYNVDKNLVNPGGSVSEVMQNIPSVTVDIDGKVALRGSENVTILIDGKPAGLTGENRAQILQQLPASSIEQIEVITNPSARYDAEGTSGIINIKTRKDKNAGLNGTISAGVGTNDKYNASVAVNRRNSETNIYGNYSFRHDQRWSEGESVRSNFYNDTTTYFDTDNRGESESDAHVLRAGVDFYLDDYNTLGVSGGMVMRDETREDAALTLVQSADFITQSGYTRFTDATEESLNYDASLDYRHTWSGSKRELTGSASFNSSQRDNTDLYTNQPLPLPADPSLQRVINEPDNLTWQFQGDYIYPAEKGKWETGIKGTFRDLLSDQMAERYDIDKATWLPDLSLTNEFEYGDNVYAAYLQYGRRISIIEVAAGLRLEHTEIDARSVTADTGFKRSYTDLFPSLSLKYSLSEGKDLQLSYSRRIQRPSPGQLNPFVNLFDSLNVMRGNPNLDPEYITAVELGYQGIYNNQTYTATLYYRYIDNYIQRYRVIDQSTNVSTMTFLNYEYSQNIGLELVARNQIGKVLSATTSLNVFRNWADATNIDEDLRSDVYSWDLRTTLNVRMTPSTSVQITANYMAPREQPQGRFKGMSGIDLGIRHDFKGNHWSMTLSVNDILDTRQFSVDNGDDSFRYQFTRKRESLVGNFNLSYRFGKSESGAAGRKRNSRPEMQQEQMEF